MLGDIIMRTSIIGHPRVGSLRELKFATEKYFRREISEEQLQNVAKEIRKNAWIAQKHSGLDFIPSNDFHSMIICWIQLCCSILFLIVIKT